MTRNRIDHTHARGLYIEALLRAATYTATLGGNFTIGQDSPPIITFDGGSSDRTITLPALVDVTYEVVYLINNIGTTHSLVIKDSAAATVGTLAHGYGALVYNDGASWYGIIMAALS